METEIDLDSEKENIRKLLKTGNSFKNIAENYNISTTKLWTFVRKNNLKENFKPFKERNRWIEDEISIVRDYLNDDKSIEEITKALNGKHSKDSVKTLITKQGKRYNLNYKHTRHYFTEKDIENIKKLSKEGYSPSKIAEELGLNKSSTPKLMKKLGIDTVDHNTDGFFRNHINLVLTKESIEELLIKKGKSTKEIAELAGVSVDSVYRRIKLFNIQRPVKEEILMTYDEGTSIANANVLSDILTKIDKDEAEEVLDETRSYFLNHQEGYYDGYKAATKWHYPSKGEYPPNNKWVFVYLNDETCTVGLYCSWAELKWMDNYENEIYYRDIVAWQYIVPPKEEA